jgi:mRNA interferase MazF
MELANLPGNVVLEKAVSGLNKTSVLNFSQIATIDKSDLTGIVCMLPKSLMQQVNAAIKQVLDIV